MEKEKAYRIISQWIEHSGKDVLVPDYLIALKQCALTSNQLDHDIFSTLRKLEYDSKYWCLWAYHTVAVYSPKKDLLTPELLDELAHIKRIAIELSDTQHGLNPWRYQLSYNPMENIILSLNFIF